MKSTKVKMKQGEIKISFKNSLESSALNNKETIKNNKHQGKINKDKMEILESVRKSSVGWIRIKLYIKQNLKELEKDCAPALSGFARALEN